MSRSLYYAKQFEDLMQSHIHVAPHIPKNMFYAAISSYAPNVKAEDVILIYDDTLMGSGSEGFLLTRDTLYYKELFTEPLRIALLPHVNYSAGRGIINKMFLLNGKKLFVITQISYAIAQELISRIDDMVKGKFDAGAPSVTPQSKEVSFTVPASEVRSKACPFCSATIKAEAIKCRFCGEMLDGSDAQPAPQRADCVTLNSEEPNPIIRIWKEFTEDFNLEKLKTRLQGFDQFQQQRTCDELESRIQNNDTDALVISLLIAIMSMDEDDGDASDFHNFGKLLGQAAAQGNKRAQAVLRMFRNSFNNKSKPKRGLFQFEVLLHAASQEYNLN